MPICFTWLCHLAELACQACRFEDHCQQWQSCHRLQGCPNLLNSSTYPSRPPARRAEGIQAVEVGKPERNKASQNVVRNSFVRSETRGNIASAMPAEERAHPCDLCHVQASARSAVAGMHTHTGLSKAPC